MNLAQALHTAARRHCNEQYDYWVKRYSKLPAEGRAADGYHYTKKALATFPRYNVLNAIRIELERTDPDILDNLEQTRNLIFNAGMNAEDDFTRDPIGPTEAAAISEERKSFCSFVAGLSDHEIRKIQPLPYHRVLSVIESEELWQKIRKRWKITDNYWYPLAEHPELEIEAFQDRYFHEFCSSLSLNELLASHDVSRVWELREFGPEFEQDVAVFTPSYNGAEGFWSSRDLDWIIYASHESSITIGGWLLQEIKNVWPEWAQRKWSSPFF